MPCGIEPDKYQLLTTADELSRTTCPFSSPCNNATGTPDVDDIEAVTTYNADLDDPNAVAAAATALAAGAAPGS